MSADLTDPIFTDADKAREFLEAQRWPTGVYCAHCGSFSVTALKGKRAKAGLYQCNDCREQFTVTVGTVFERSHVPLNKWMLAAYLLSSSKKGISSHQLHRMLGVTYKTAWFMSHRLREAMKDTKGGGLGGEGQHVEADETFIGTKRPRKVIPDKRHGGTKLAKGTSHKHAVLTMVERGGRARSFHVDRLDRETIYGTLFTNVDRKSRLQTDEATHYRLMGQHFQGGHGHVRHKLDQYVKGLDHTQTVEGFFSIFKRGMIGIYQHCGSQHLQRYLTEFDFRYSNRKISDWERTAEALKGAEGKRLTYRRPRGGQARLPQAPA